MHYQLFEMSDCRKCTEIVKLVNAPMLFLYRYHLSILSQINMKLGDFACRILSHLAYAILSAVLNLVTLCDLCDYQRSRNIFHLGHSRTDRPLHYRDNCE